MRLDHRYLMYRQRLVAVSAARIDDRVVITASLSAGDIGHAFPTGDPFRRGELAVWVDGGERDSEELARTFADRLERSGSRVHLVRRQVADSRIAAAMSDNPAPIEIELRVRAARGATIHWSLDHLLMPDAMATEQGVGQGINRMRVHEGTLGAP